MQLNLEKERSAVSALEKKQRKFDQVCAFLCALWGKNLPSQMTLRECRESGVTFLLLVKNKLKKTVF